MRFRKLVFGFALAFGAWLAPKASLAVTCSVAHTFGTGEVLNAINLNANPAAEVNCINNIDFLNIGTAGIKASQIIPLTVGQAVFGGTQTYAFVNGLIVTGDLVLGRNAAQAVTYYGTTSGQFLDYGITTAGHFSLSGGPLDLIGNPLSTANGGTGSATQNFVDLTTAQTVAGKKTFTSGTAFSSGTPVTGGFLNVGNYPSNTPNALYFSGTGTKITSLGSNDTSIVAGTNGGILNIAWVGTANLLTLDATGALGVGGAISSGTGTGHAVPYDAESPGNTPSEHSERHTFGTISAGAPQVFTYATPFTSATSYQCAATSYAGASTAWMTVKSATGVSIGMYGSPSAADVICTGT